MILISRISSVAQLLLDAALSEGTISFKIFHGLFDVHANDNDKYDTLEASDRALCRSPIYSALLSKASTGCPGSGFFDIFKNTRPDAYREIAGECIVQYLTLDQMQAITWQERQRVYEHAKAHFGGP
jgi:hypothetical protein